MRGRSSPGLYRKIYPNCTILNLSLIATIASDFPQKSRNSWKSGRKHPSAERFFRLLARIRVCEGQLHAVRTHTADGKIRSCGNPFSIDSFARKWRHRGPALRMDCPCDQFLAGTGRSYDQRWSVDIDRTSGRITKKDSAPPLISGPLGQHHGRPADPRSPNRIRGKCFAI